MFNLTSEQEAAMTETRIGPLRQRMIDDMTIRKMASKIQAAYIRAVKTFTIFLGRSPDTASSEDLRRFQLHQTRIIEGTA